MLLLLLKHACACAPRPAVLAHAYAASSTKKFSGLVKLLSVRENVKETAHAEAEQDTKTLLMNSEDMVKNMVHQRTHELAQQLAESEIRTAAHVEAVTVSTTLHVYSTAELSLTLLWRLGCFERANQLGFGKTRC